MQDHPIDEAAAQRAWREYVAALDTANTSRRFSDSLAAGKAWRRFLDVFITPEQRRAVGTARPE